MRFTLDILRHLKTFKNASKTTNMQLWVNSHTHTHRCIKCRAQADTYPDVASVAPAAAAAPVSAPEHAPAADQLLMPHLLYHLLP